MSDNVTANPGSGGATFATDDISGVMYPRTKIVLGDDGVNGGDVSVANPMPINKVYTTFIYSANGVNSTTTQLAASATFTGTWESITNQPAWSIEFSSDQPGTLYVDQSMDNSGVYPVQTNSFTNTAGQTVMVSRPANGDYIRVRYQNTGGATTTLLKVVTAYGEILPATPSQNAPVAISEVAAGVTVPISATSLPLPSGAATNAGITGAGSKTLTDVVNGQTTLGSQTTKINDGTNTAAVKAASTAPVAADPALVVAVSPNAAIPVSAIASLVTSVPSSQSFTATGVAAFGVTPGGAYALTVTNAPSSTAAFAGTIGFQWSPDGNAWNNLNARPLSSLPGAGAVNVTSTTAHGLWLVVAPANCTQIRFNCSAYTSGTIWCYLEPWAIGSVIELPWVYTVTSGQSVTPWIESSLLGNITIRHSAITGGTYVLQGTSDPTATDVQSIAVKDTGSNITTGTLTITTVPTSAYGVGTHGFKWVRLQCTVTGTVLTFTGITATVMPPSAQVSSAYSNTVYATTSNASMNIGQVLAATVTGQNPNGLSTATKSMGVYLTSATSNTDQSATAFAGAGRVNGTLVVPTSGAGAVISAEINVSALTLGTATSVVPILQESRGGTNVTDIWVGDPITTTGIVSVPAIPISGRRRWCMHSVGGTSTTVTVTITALEMPAGYVTWRQFRDAYSATNPFATVINSVTTAASTFGAATALTATTQATSWFNVENCKNLTFFVVLGGSPTVTTQPVISAEFSNDTTNVLTTANTMTAAGNGVYSVNVSGSIFKLARLRVTTAAAYSAGAYTITSVGVMGVN